jgi:hypothetical protein
VIYVDRNQLPAQLPVTVDGVRARYVVMERLHVTRSYAAASRLHCIPKPERTDWRELLLPLRLGLD